MHVPPSSTARRLDNIPSLNVFPGGVPIPDGGGSTDHATLDNLEWSASGHMGTPGYFAAFNVDTGFAESVPVSADARSMLSQTDVTAIRQFLGAQPATDLLDSISGLDGGTPAIGLIATEGGAAYHVVLTSVSSALTISAGNGASGVNPTFALHAGLQSFAGVSSAADLFGYTTAANTWAAATITAAGRALLDDADASAMRTTLGLAIGTNVQAYSGELAAVAGLSGTGLVRRTGSNTWTVGALVTLAESADLAGLSVVGRSANSSGVMAAITAATVGHALQLNDAGTSLAFREPSFATRTLAGAIRAGRFPEASGTPFLFPIEITNATTSTTTASVANRCMFYRLPWEWASNQRFDAMVCEVTTFAAGTGLRMALYTEGADGLPASRIWYSAPVDAGSNGIKTELLSSGTWVDTSYKDASGYLTAPPGTVIWGALHTESTPTLRAVAVSAIRPICMLTGTLTSQNLLYVSSSYASGVPTAPSSFTTANGTKQILCLRGVP